MRANKPPVIVTVEPANASSTFGESGGGTGSGRPTTCAAAGRVTGSAISPRMTETGVFVLRTGLRLLARHTVPNAWRSPAGVRQMRPNSRGPSLAREGADGGFYPL